MGNHDSYSDPTPGPERGWDALRQKNPRGRASVLAPGALERRSARPPSPKVHAAAGIRTSANFSGKRTEGHRDQEPAVLRSQLSLSPAQYASVPGLLRDRRPASTPGAIGEEVPWTFRKRCATPLRTNGSPSMAKVPRAVGITAVASDQLGDMVYVELPKVGARFKR